MLLHVVCPWHVLIGTCTRALQVECRGKVQIGLALIACGLDFFAVVLMVRGSKPILPLLLCMMALLVLHVGRTLPF